MKEIMGWTVGRFLGSGIQSLQFSNIDDVAKNVLNSPPKRTAGSLERSSTVHDLPNLRAFDS